jgi:hypothetical protein
MAYTKEKPKWKNSVRIVEKSTSAKNTLNTLEKCQNWFVWIKISQ